MFLVYFECEAENFGHLMQKFGPHLQLVTNLRIETQMEKTTRKRAPKAQDPSTPPRQDGREYNPNSRIHRLLMGELKGSLTHKITYEMGKKLLEANDLSPNSLSPAITALRFAGMITTKDQVISLVPKE